MTAQENAPITRYSSIRTRLIWSFVLIVLVPMTIISTVLVISATQSARSQVTTQLQTVTNYKKTAIKDLLSGLQTQLKTSALSDTVNYNLRTLLQTPTDSLEFTIASQYTENHFKQFIEESGQFQVILVLNTEGQVLFSTETTEEGKNYKNEVFFQGSQYGSFTYLSSFTQTIIVTNPLTNTDNEIIGFIAGKASTATLNKIMQNSDGLGKTGKTYLISLGRLLLTALPEAEIGNEITSPGIITVLDGQSNGSASYKNFIGVPVVGVYDWIPELKAGIMSEQEQSEASGPIYAILAVNIGLALAAILIAAVASLQVTRSIAAPIDNLAETATQIAEGHLELEAEVERTDEIGKLAIAFNNMTRQLRQNLESLERRVQDRTFDLEQRTAELEKSSTELAEASRQIQKRAIQAETISKIANSIASIQNLQELLPLITHVISEQFGYYHTGIFLTDKANEYAVLSAANSEGGQRMLARGHRLGIGQTGIVGYAVATGKPRIALDTGKDAVFFENPDLPETRSEMALPLRIGDKIIGALDVQSIESNAFTEQDTETLSTLADQVSIAIQNSRLFEETQKSLTEINTIYRQTLHETWAKTTGEQETSGYRFGPMGSQPLRSQLKTKGIDQALTNGELIILQEELSPELAVPIKVRGQTIGILNVQAPDGHTWRQSEINILKAIAERVAVSAENARLFDETTSRAERERTVSAITTKIRSTNNPEEMLVIAMAELKNVLNVKDIRITSAKDSAN